MKRLIFAHCIAAALVISLSAVAQEITPVWEHLATDENSPLPILKAQNDPSAAVVYTGNSLYDFYGGFKRYDENRLLLSIVENGINETDPNHDADLAAQFPDRSLIWINPTDGSPMGVALVIGQTPIELSQNFLDRGGSAVDVFMNFDVADDGSIYVGYKNTIIRYSPDGADGFAAPVKVYEHPDDGSDTWPAWRWENLRVSGSGSNTVIVAGPKTWRTNMGYYILATQDGNTFSVNGYVPNGFAQASGGGSHLIRPGDGFEYVLVSTYPGSDRGDGTTFYRYFRFEDTDTDFEKDPPDFFAAEKDGDAPLDEYRTEFISDVDGRSELDYVVAYSTPSWNTIGIGRTEYSPGWLAIHDFEFGGFLSAYQLGVTEESHLQQGSDPPISPFYGTLGAVTLYVPATAAPGGSEVLWYGGIYGYGRYTIGDTGLADWTVY